MDITRERDSTTVRVLRVMKKNHVIKCIDVTDGVFKHNTSNDTCSRCKSVQSIATGKKRRSTNTD